MAKTTTNPFTQTIKNPTAVLFNSSLAIGTGDYGTAPPNTVLFATAGVEGAIIKGITVSSSDTAVRTLQFFISKDSGTTQTLLFTIAVPANSGFTTVAMVDVLTTATVLGLPVDQSGRPVIPLEAGARIYVGTTVAVTSGRTVYVDGFQEDF
jgi:hypothetical protein